MKNRQAAAPKQKIHRRLAGKSMRQGRTDLSIHPILEYHQELGNRGFGRFIQARVKIGQPGDKYEQEADRLADQVMKMPGSEHSDEKELLLQPKKTSIRTPNVTPEISANISALRGRGRPLPDSVRNFFEPRFGHDFSRVKIHTDARAAKTARALNARAFTTGNNIMLGVGQYSPNTTTGKHLLAHELTHVLQQDVHGLIQRKTRKRKKLSIADQKKLREMSKRKRRRAAKRLKSPKGQRSGTGGWLEYNNANIKKFRKYFSPSMPQGLTADDLANNLSSDFTKWNPTYKELPPENLWPNMIPTLKLLDDLGTGSGTQFKILSAYRSDIVNALAKGEVGSEHKGFYALDLLPLGGRRVRKKFEAYVKYFWHKKGRSRKFGLGFYSRKRVHVDTKKRRRWEWSESKRNSYKRYKKYKKQFPVQI